MKLSFLTIIFTIVTIITMIYIKLLNGDLFGLDHSSYYNKLSPHLYEDVYKEYVSMIDSQSTRLYPEQLVLLTDSGQRIERYVNLEVEDETLLCLVILPILSVNLTEQSMLEVNQIELEFYTTSHHEYTLTEVIWINKNISGWFYVYFLKYDKKTKNFEVRSVNVPLPKLKIMPRHMLTDICLQRLDYIINEQE